MRKSDSIGETHVAGIPVEFVAEIIMHMIRFMPRRPGWDTYDGDMGAGNMTLTINRMNDQTQIRTYALIARDWSVSASFIPEEYVAFERRANELPFIIIEGKMLVCFRVRYKNQRGWIRDATYLKMLGNKCGEWAKPEVTA